MSAYDWMGSALCAQTDPGIFFRTNGGSHSSTKARNVCSVCPVRARCEAHVRRLEGSADESRRHGTWAGRLPRERAEIGGERQARDKDRDAAIARLTEQGESAAAIAQQVGCTSRTVIRVRARQRQVTA